MTSQAPRPAPSDQVKPPPPPSPPRLGATRHATMRLADIAFLDALFDRIRRATSAEELWRFVTGEEDGDDADPLRAAHDIVRALLSRQD